jgi:hypothetical protein
MVNTSNAVEDVSAGEYNYRKHRERQCDTTNSKKQLKGYLIGKQLWRLRLTPRLQLKIWQCKRELN